MKYIVILPECYQAHRPARLANPEFKDHREAVRNAIAISKVTGVGVEIKRFPKPYTRKEMVLSV
ncbi:MAG TPA: hypothetical protein DHU75_09350 [Rikenellaceae bacterium]|nr:hypothetical protein [Rikenellaceae bacterium]